MFTQASKTEYTAAAFHFPGTHGGIPKTASPLSNHPLSTGTGTSKFPNNLPDPLWERKSLRRNKVMHQVEKNKLLAKNAFNESAGKMKIMTKKEMFNLSRKLLRKP